MAERVAAKEAALGVERVGEGIMEAEEAVAEAAALAVLMVAVAMVEEVKAAVVKEVK